MANKNFTQHAYCFFMHAILVKQSIEDAREVRRRFIADIENRPDTPHYLSDYKENREYSYSNTDGLTYCVHFTNKNNVVDKHCVIEVARLLSARDEKYKQKRFCACIWMLLKDTNSPIGIGHKGMSAMEFTKYISEYISLKEQILYDYSDNSPYPHWHIKGKEDEEASNRITKEALDYANLFISKYKELYAKTYSEKGMTLEDLKKTLDI